MQKITPLLILFCLSFFTNAQESKNHTVNIKLYSNVNFLHSEDQNFVLSGDSLNNSNQIKLFISPAFTFVRQNGNFHEIELSEFSFNKTNNKSSLTNNSGTLYSVDGERVTNYSISLRYEYGFMFLKKANSKIHPYLGVSIHPYYSYTNSNPLLSTFYRTSETSIGVNVSIVPRIQWNISERFLLDLNVPFSIASTELNLIRNENPTYTTEQQSTYKILGDVLASKYLVRLGIGFKI